MFTLFKAVWHPFAWSCNSDSAVPRRQNSGQQTLWVLACAISFDNFVNNLSLSFSNVFLPLFLFMFGIAIAMIDRLWEARDFYFILTRSHANDEVWIQQKIFKSPVTLRRRLVTDRAKAGMWSTQLSLLYNLVWVHLYHLCVFMFNCCRLVYFHRCLVCGVLLSSGGPLFVNVRSTLSCFIFHCILFVIFLRLSICCGTVF